MERMRSGAMGALGGEWAQVEGGPHRIHVGEEPIDTEIPDFADRLPQEIRRFTRAGVYGDWDDAHRSFVQGGGRGGSHPHLVDALIGAVLGTAPAYPDAVRAADITCAGLLSHASAMAGSVRMPLPECRLSGDRALEFPLGPSRPAGADVAAAAGT